MSLLLELAGRQGHICPPGHVRTGGCPMLLRANSEDLMTGTAVAVLKNLTPSKWLGAWLNEAFQTNEFDEARFDNLHFELWPSLTPPPGLKHREGSSKPDLIVTFDDAVIVVEAKYLADLSTGTTHHPHRNQLVRFVDVVYHHYGGSQLFPRRVYLMTLTLTVPALAKRYRDRTLLAQDLTLFGCSQPAAEAIASTVCIGSSTWDALGRVLASKLEAFQENSIEEAFVLDLITYLTLKTTQARVKDSPVVAV